MLFLEGADMKAKDAIGIAIAIVIVTMFTIFLGTRKVGYHVDEMWNYGLANSVGSVVPKIENGKVYQGMGPFEDYFEVRSGERFNYVSVWQNQAKDVHPPLYYCLFHTLCSFFPNSFSKWYGIAFNLICMIFIMIGLAKLSFDITQSKVLAFGVPLIYGTTILFLDMMVFIRMYSQFTLLAIVLTLLIERYWQKDLDKKFYRLLAALIILGTLTHYYFLVFAFGICAFFAIRLIIDKRYEELKKCIITAICSGVIYFAMWYHIAGHLFRGYRGKEAISNFVSFKNIFAGAIPLAKILNKELFAEFALVIVVLGVVYGIVKIKDKSISFGFNEALLLSAIFYVFIVGKIAPYKSSRYVMPVGFILILLGVVICKGVLKRLVSEKIAEALIIAIFLGMNIFNLGARDFYVPMDNNSEELATILPVVADKEVVLVYESDWEVLNFFLQLENAKCYVMVNEESFDSVIDNINEDFILMSYAIDLDSITEKLETEKIYESGSKSYYYVRR